MLEPDSGQRALSRPVLSRRGLFVAATGFVCVIFASAARAQRRADDSEAPLRDNRQVDPVSGQVCRPMCAEDLSPCDPPTMKAREGRCSSPTAGFVGG
jgi:hypothetical protein